MEDYSKYYVYYHIDPETKEIVYVGLGKLGRAWQMRYSKGSGPQYGQRSKEHWEWYLTADSKGYLISDCVKIKHRNLTKEKAKEIEEKLIFKLKPKFNKDGNPNYSRPSIFNSEQKEFIKSLRDMGFSYTHIAFLCGAEGKESRKNTHAMTIWRVING